MEHEKETLVYQPNYNNVKPSCLTVPSCIVKGLRDKTALRQAARNIFILIVSTLFSDSGGIQLSVKTSVNSTSVRRNKSGPTPAVSYQPSPRAT
jgi:hypothetical protein